MKPVLRFTKPLASATLHVSFKREISIEKLNNVSAIYQGVSKQQLLIGV